MCCELVQHMQDLHRPLQCTVILVEIRGVGKVKRCFAEWCATARGRSCCVSWQRSPVFVMQAATCTSVPLTRDFRSPLQASAACNDALKTLATDTLHARQRTYAVGTGRPGNEFTAYCSKSSSLLHQLRSIAVVAFFSTSRQVPK